MGNEDRFTVNQTGGRPRPIDSDDLDGAEARRATRPRTNAAPASRNYRWLTDYTVDQLQFRITSFKQYFPNYGRRDGGRSRVPSWLPLFERTGAELFAIQSSQPPPNSQMIFLTLELVGEYGAYKKKFAFNSIVTVRTDQSDTQVMTIGGDTQALYAEHFKWRQRLEHYAREKTESIKDPQMRDIAYKGHLLFAPLFNPEIGLDPLKQVVTKAEGAVQTLDATVTSGTKVNLEIKEAK